MTKNNNRIAGDYEIIQSIEIGHAEVVFGINQKDTDDRKYMCAYAKNDDFFVTYDDILVSNNYAEIMQIFGNRVSKEASIIQKEISNLNIPITVITKDDCIPDNRAKDITGKIIAIDSKMFRPEFQRADRQIYIVKGGFGANANARGNAVFCKNVYDGKSERFERNDILGEVKPDCIPQWAKDILSGKTEKENRIKEMELKEIQKLLDDRECKDDILPKNNNPKKNRDFTR